MRQPSERGQTSRGGRVPRGREGASSGVYAGWQAAGLWGGPDACGRPGSRIDGEVGREARPFRWALLALSSLAASPLGQRLRCPSYLAVDGGIADRGRSCRLESPPGGRGLEPKPAPNPPRLISDVSPHFTVSKPSSSSRLNRRDQWNRRPGSSLTGPRHRGGSYSRGLGSCRGRRSSPWRWPCAAS